MSYLSKSYAYMVDNSTIAISRGMDQDETTSFRRYDRCYLADQHPSSAFKTFICRAGAFEVLSYHCCNGPIIVTATDELGNLRPTEGHMNATCRPGGIQFVKLATDIIFIDIDPADTQLYPFTLLLCLNMENRVVHKSTGNEVNLYTFHCPAIWATTLDQAVLDEIWDNPRSLRQPFWLAPSDIADINSDTRIQVKMCILRLEMLALDATWTVITKRVFDQLCPNFIEDPAIVIQSIHHESRGNGDIMVALTVEQYLK
jgi:hypothetical protein